MRVLVTGGAGFVGTNLIKRLVECGHDVISVDNYHTGLICNHVNGCRYVNQDIAKVCDYGWFSDGEAPQIVFHMAAIARIQPSFENPRAYFETNANGTLHVAEWCAKHNVPMVYAGSSSKHSGRFKNPYTFSKDVGEDVIELYQHHFGLQASITRFYNVYGPYQLLEGGYTTLIGRWINNIQNGIQCEIYGTGEKRRDFTHVDDIVDALVMIMEQGAYGYIFELGRGKNYSVNEVASMFGIDPIYKEDKPGEAEITLNDSTLARDILQWNPTKDLETYIKNLNL